MTEATNNVAVQPQVKTLVEKFRESNKAALNHLQTELQIKEHLLAAADALECTLVPKMVNVFNLYGSIGSLSFETKSIDDVLSLINTFEPLGIQYWVNGCAYFKPYALLKAGEKKIQGATGWCGVTFDCDTFGQSFEWYTQHGDTVFRIKVDVSPWGFGGKQMNYRLPTVWEKRKSDYDSSSKLLEWGINNPRNLGNRVVRMSGGPGNSGHGRVLWADLDTCKIELEQLS